MVRIWRRPGILMIAYVILFGLAEPWSARSSPAAVGHLSHAVDPGALLFAAFLAWRVSRGGSLARGLLVLGTGVQISGLLTSPGMRSGNPVSFGLLAIYLVQIALLVSTPVYFRTRKTQVGLAPDGSRLWVLPPRWMPVAALSAGVILTLLFLGNMDFQTVQGCQAPGYLTPGSAPLSQCMTLAEGYPIHYLSASPSLSLNSGTKVTPANLALLADPVIGKSAAAEDLAIWTLVSFTGFYLLWLPSRRSESAAIGELIPAQG